MIKTSLQLKRFDSLRIDYKHYMEESGEFTMSFCHYKGRIGEMRTYYAVKQLSSKFGLYNIVHNDFRPREYCLGSCHYENGVLTNNDKSVDLTFNIDSQKFYVEIKYISNYIRLGFEWIKRHIIERFNVKDPYHRGTWILIISKLNCSKHIKQLLRSYGIHVINVGQYRINIIKHQLTRFIKSYNGNNHGDKSHINSNYCNKGVTDKDRFYVTALLTSFIVTLNSMKRDKIFNGG